MVYGSTWYYLRINFFFFVLEKLYEFASPDYCKAKNGNDIKEVTFLELPYFSRRGMRPPDLLDIKEVKHFTDMIRSFFCSKLDATGLEFKEVKGISSILCLKAWRSRIEIQKGLKKGLLQIKFSQKVCFGHLPFDISFLLSCLPCLKCFPCLESRQHILKVPQLLRDDDTEAHFRNLMALEQHQYYSFKPYICNYVTVLDYLINIEKDVDLLVDEKVIINNIGCNTAVMTRQSDCWR